MTATITRTEQPDYHHNMTGTVTGTELVGMTRTQENYKTRILNGYII